MAVKEEINDEGGVVEETTPTDVTVNSELLDMSPEYLPRPMARSGEIVRGKVVDVTEDYAVVSIGQKSEGILASKEMRRFNQSNTLSVGDEIETYVLSPEASRTGTIELSLDRAQIPNSWHKIEEWQKNGETASGKIADLNRGGLVVQVEGLQGFIPLSHVTTPFKEIYAGGAGADLTKIRGELVGKDIEFKIMEFNKRQGRAIFSHRLAVQETKEKQKAKLMETLEEGQVIEGKIVGLSDFGAFVDIGGADGLVHISEISWESVRKPSAILKIGQVLDVFVLKIDHEEMKIALSLKRLQPEPWKVAEGQFEEGKIVQAEITNVVQFGAFAKVSTGVEGLIHLSELSYDKVDHPSSIVNVGDKLDVVILRLDTERKRLGLSLKRTKPDPRQQDGQKAEKSESTEDENKDAEDVAEIKAETEQAAETPKAEDEKVDDSDTNTDDKDEPTVEDDTTPVTDEVETETEVGDDSDKTE